MPITRPYKMAPIRLPGILALTFPLQQVLTPNEDLFQHIHGYSKKVAVPLTYKNELSLKKID